MKIDVTQVLTDLTGEPILETTKGPELTLATAAINALLAPVQDPQLQKRNGERYALAFKIQRAVTAKKPVEVTAKEITLAEDLLRAVYAAPLISEGAINMLNQKDLNDG